MNDRRRFFDALPFYVNGTLPTADRAWVDDYLAAHPGLQGQHAFCAAVQARVAERVEASIAELPRDFGYAHLRSLIADDLASTLPSGASIATPVTLALSPATRGRAGVGAASTPWWQRLFAPTTPRWTYALVPVLLLCIVGVQTALLVQRALPTYSDVRSTPAAPIDGALLRVNFKPDANESAIRLALIDARAHIIAGPTRLGDYYLKVPAGRAAAARDALLRAGVTESVDEVPQLPEDLVQ